MAEQGISHGERAEVTETAEPDLVPPGLRPYYPSEDNASAEDQIDRLSEFLLANFPGEIGRSNYQVSEGAVDVAIRLLSALSTRGTQIERCEAEYCNRPRGHREAHAWVHYS